MQNSPKPLVSIVIPVYNHAKYLSEAIDSILSQDYSNIELIVLNDGSTDNTVQVLEKYKGQFYSESHQNMGQANTLNKGWRMAKGDMLGYLSADDVLFPSAISECVDCLQNNYQAVLTYPDFQLIDSESRVIRRVIAPEYSYKEMVTNFNCAPGPGAIFRRDAYIKAGEWNPELRHSPDYEYWLRLGLYGSFEHLKKTLAAFRVHDDSQSFAPTSINRAEEAIRIIENYYRLPNLPKEIIAAKIHSIANANIVVAQLHLRSGRYKETIKRLLITIKLQVKVLFSMRALRMLANGLFNRLGHRLLWLIKNFMRRK
jgi:glycosyltransferase involved in cell wall biosynthesis